MKISKVCQGLSERKICNGKKMGQDENGTSKSRSKRHHRRSGHLVKDYLRARTIKLYDSQELRKQNLVMRLERFVAR